MVAAGLQNSNVLKCELNVLKNTDGSAMHTEGNTTVMAGVYGPGDCRESRQDVKRAIVDVNFRPKFGIPGVGEKYTEKFVRQVCEGAIIVDEHPRTAFCVIAQIMEEQGSLLACAINAVTLALQNAGVSMHFLPVAVAVAIAAPDTLPTGGAVDGADRPEEVAVVRPSRSEESRASASITFVFDSTNGDLVSCCEHGVISSKHYDDALEAARRESDTILSFYRDVAGQKI